MAFLQQNTAYNRMIFLVNACDHLTKAISISSIAATLSKNAAAFAGAGGSVVEVGSGWYKLTMTTTDTNTLGDLACHVTDATGKVDDTDFVDQIVAMSFNATTPTNWGSFLLDSAGRVDLGKWMGSSLASVNVSGVPTVDLARWLGSIPNALIGGRVDANATLAAGLPTNFSSLLIDTSGRVDLGKWMGSSLASVNVSGVPIVDLARWLGSIPNALIAGRVDANATLSGGVVVTTNNDKTGYSLTQAFPTNFSSLLIDGSGRVDLGKWMGSSLASVNVSGIPTVDLARWLGSIPNPLLGGRVDANATLSAGVTVTANNDKTGYSLAAGGLFIKKNTILSSFMFLMLDSTDHITPKTGLTVSGTVSIDGAAFGALANSVTEIASGVYKVNLAAADTNGTSLMLKFTATGADARYIPIITQT